MKSPRFIQSSFLLTFLFVCSFISSGCASTPPTLKSESISSEVLDSKTTHHVAVFTGKGILWKIQIPSLNPNSRNALKPSYVFGTIHSEDDRVIKLPPKINKAFVEAKIFAMEMVLDAKTSKAILRGMYFGDERTLKSMTTPEVYAKAIEAMKARDMPENLVNMMKPWAIFTVLNMPVQETGLFLDARLYQSALKENKKVVGLETMQEQLAVFDDMSIATQVSLLETTLESGDDLNEILDETIDIYLTRDLQKILDLNDRYVSMLDKDIADEFNQRLLIDRNIRMADRMVPLINEGNAFIAIGTLHLPGEGGVLDLLQQKGYIISVVY